MEKERNTVEYAGKHLAVFFRLKGSGAQAVEVTQVGDLPWEEKVSDWSGDEMCRRRKDGAMYIQSEASVNQSSVNPW